MSQETTPSASRPVATAAPQAIAAPSPGIFSPKGEKALYKALQSGDLKQVEDVASRFPDHAAPAACIAGLESAANQDWTQAELLLRQALRATPPVESHPFVVKYIVTREIYESVSIAPGVTVDLPYTHDMLSLVLAEVLQAQGKIAEAIEVVEQLDPTTYAAVSLSELYLEADRSAEIIDLTNGISNEDDATALLCVYRAVAMREQEHYDAAREALKEALKSKRRAPEIRHRALVERAETYLAQGRTSFARRDLERVLAEDASYPGLQERLAELS
jgi:predicted Zn-dependent protease